MVSGLKGGHSGMDIIKQKELMPIGYWKSPCGSNK